jgi:hypothetical protein
LSTLSQWPVLLHALSYSTTTLAWIVFRPSGARETDGNRQRLHKDRVDRLMTSMGGNVSTTFDVNQDGAAARGRSSLGAETTNAGCSMLKAKMMPKLIASLVLVAFFSRPSLFR